MSRPDAAVLRSYLGSVLLVESAAAVEAKLVARPNRAELVEAEREPGRPRRFTAHSRIPSVEHVATMTVAGPPPQPLAYYQALVDAGMRYFIVSYGRDDETLRLLARDVAPHVRVPA